MDRSSRLTEGNILKGLLLFAVPMMLGNMLQQVYNIVDALVVGRVVGPDALAAVGSAYTLMVFLTSIITGLCMGSGALFAAACGAGRPDDLRRDVCLSAVFIAFVTAVLYVIVFAATDPILRLLSIPGSVWPYMRGYVRIVFAGIGFVSLYNFFAYLLRSLGNSTVPLYFLAGSSLLNVALDIVFVVLLGRGIEGAAGATVISQFVCGAGIALYTARRYGAITEKAGLPRAEGPRAPLSPLLSWKRLAAVIRNGLFTSMQQSVMNFGILMVQGLVNSFGAVVMAAFAAGVKIDTFSYIPSQEFGNAYSLFVSQNYGAGRRDRIERGTLLAAAFTAGLAVFISVIVCVFPAQLIGLFVSDAAASAEMIAVGTGYLRIEGAFYFGIALLFMGYAYFRGIGRPEMSLVLTIVSLGTRVLLAYTLAPNTPLGVKAIWMAIPIGWILADIAAAVFHQKIKY